MIKRTISGQKYLMLAVNMLEPELRDRLENETKALATPDQVMDFIVKSNPAGDATWKFLWMSATEFRSGLLLYRGVEVALYFRRQTMERKPDPEAPLETAPSRTLKSKEEAWVRVSLLEAKSAYKQAQFFTSEFTQLQEMKDHYQKLSESQSNLIDQQGQRIFALETQIEESKKQTVKK